jgi:hypothetical protein
MEYSAIKAAWLIYPQKQGAVADDFVMRGEVGAANGVAGLDGNGKVAAAQLPQMDYIPTEGQIIGNTESSLLVEPAKFYDWRPAATTATLNVATGVDTSKAWCSLIRLTKGSLSLISSSTITLKEGTWRNLQPITFVLVVCDGAAVTAYNIITKDTVDNEVTEPLHVAEDNIISGIGSNYIDMVWEAIDKEAEKIEGVSRADVFISSHQLRKRYDMMIRIRMKKTALSSFEGSEVMAKWKREYGEKIENVTVFNS